ncbi:arrestin domain-containing protein 3-like [Haliotis rubra]|uniref:arrestin domain-containing protein 3-like n=1 Tax=Haliotis rubra TaxID=36100 RepID=UPI001EE5E662|nr:arrestin domain-containing protein 3-like [Haliotis rubra]
MGKLNMFVVSFSNLQGVYYAGQAVQGHVTVELTDTMKMRGIHIRFEGRAYVHWSETETTGSGDNQQTVTHDYSASEKYFKEDILLAGRWKQQSGDDIHLPAGRHTFPFAFQLPPQLPSSFEGEDGHVRYTAKGIIDKPWKFDHETKRPFTVICLLDLNRDPNAMIPAQGANSKTLCCWCCASGPISANFIIDRQGYVPGEAIILKAEIDNQSNRRIKSSVCEIDNGKASNSMCECFLPLGLLYPLPLTTWPQVTMFHATTKTRTSSRVIAKLKHGEIDEGGHDYWNGDQLVIPPVPPSFLAGCNIIDIRYFVQLEVTPSGPSSDLKVPLQVIIGTIPLQSVLAQHPPIAPPVGAPIIMPNPGMAGGTYPPPGAGAYPQPGAYPPPTGAYPPGESLPPGAPPAYPPGMPTDWPNLPPPSYGECVFGKVDIKEEGESEHLQGDNRYAPVYTYYDWGHKPSAPPSE